MSILLKLLIKEVLFLSVAEIMNNLKNGVRLSTLDAIELFLEGDILEIAGLAAADAANRHGDTVTFVIDRNINYTNICKVGCKFCAFYCDHENEKAYVLTHEEIFTKVQEALALGATQIMLQGGLNDQIEFDYYIGMVKGIKERFNITVHSFSPPEIAHMAELTGLSLEEILVELRDAGLDSLPGGGAEILVDRVRHEISPKKITSSKWLEVMETAHRLGIESTATMMMGNIETLEERFAHLEKIRALQDKTGGFRAFIPWTYQPYNTELGGKKMSSYHYLKFLAVCRLYLDNFDHIQGSWVTQGPDIGQLTLFFGGRDLGSIMLEENVVRAAGAEFRMQLQSMIDLIKNAGFNPAQRDTEYRIIKRY